MKRNTFLLMMKAFKQIVLAKTGSSSEDDDDEGDDIQITVTTTRSGRRAPRYLF